LKKGHYEDTDELFEFAADSAKVNKTIQEKASEREAGRKANNLMTFDRFGTTVDQFYLPIHT